MVLVLLIKMYIKSKFFPSVGKKKKYFFVALRKVEKETRLCFIIMFKVKTREMCKKAGILNAVSTSATCASSPIVRILLCAERKFGASLIKNYEQL